MGYCLWLGPINHVQWATNIIFFVSWIYFPLSCLALIGSIYPDRTKEEQENIEKAYKKLSPEWYFKLQVLYEVIFIIILAATGFFVLATLQTFSATAIMSAREMVKKNAKEP